MVYNLMKRDDGIKWQSKGTMYSKDDWDRVLSSRMLLNNREIIHLDEFLSNGGLIEEFGDSHLLIRARFGVSREDGYVYVLVPYEDGHKREFVQYTIKILGWSR